MSVSPTSSANDTINGNACVAANLSQAGELRWNGARVLNPVTNTRSLFVTCTISTGHKWVRNGGDATSLAFTTPNAGGIEAFFEARASHLAEASCTFREVNSRNTDISVADNVTMVIENPAELPIFPFIFTPAGTAAAVFTEADGLAFGSFLGAIATQKSSMTVTCELDRGVGINMIWATQSTPT